MTVENTGVALARQATEALRRLDDEGRALRPDGVDHFTWTADVLDELARETGKSVPQIAINWLLQRPTIATLVIGARNEEQLKQNLGAVGWNLSADHMAKLDAASTVTLPYPYWHQAQFAERNPSPVPVASAE